MPYGIMQYLRSLQRKQTIKTTRKVHAMSIKTKSLIILVVLGIIDVVIPIPILGVILICVVVRRPPWFTNVVREIYNPK